MNIKAIQDAYSIGEKTIVELPIDDVKEFTLVHKHGYNGTQIMVHMKDELTTSMKAVRKEDGQYDIENKDQYGIYRRKYPMGAYMIRNKDMPKFTKTLRKMFKDKETKSKTVGVNAGTPIARSWQVNWKEIVPEELQ